MKQRHFLPDDIEGARAVGRRRVARRKRENIAKLRICLRHSGASASSVAGTAGTFIFKRAARAWTKSVNAARTCRHRTPHGWRLRRGIFWRLHAWSKRLRIPAPPTSRAPPLRRHLFESS